MAKRKKPIGEWILEHAGNRGPVAGVEHKLTNLGEPTIPVLLKAPEELILFEKLMTNVIHQYNEDAECIHLMHHFNWSDKGNEICYIICADKAAMNDLIASRAGDDERHFKKMYFAVGFVEIEPQY